jgi:HlyD family secretion protein
MIAQSSPLAAPAPPGPRSGRTFRPPATVRRRKLMRQARWIGFGVVLLALVAWALWPRPLAVETAAVGRGPLRVTVDEDGVTRVQDRYVVSAPVAGRLLRVELEEGDAVAAGEVVARIAAAPLDARTAEQGRARVAGAEAVMRQAQAALATRRAEYQQARRDAARTATLERAGAVSPQAREQAETGVEVRLSAAQAELAAARAAVAGADARRVEGATVTEVRSPVAGRVLRVAQQSEAVVAPGTPLVELGDARVLEVRVDVLSTDAVRIEPGMPILLEEWGGPGALRATVRTVSPNAFTHVSALGVEEQRVNVIGDLVSSSPRLGEGYRVEARIVTWERPDVLRVPGSALFRRGGGWAAFVVDAGRAHLRTVTVGHRGESDAEVLGGLTSGERVILYPSDRVGDGVKVRSD